MIRQGPGTAPHSRIRIGLGAAVVLLLVGLGVAILASAFSSPGSTRTVPAASAPTRPEVSRYAATHSPPKAAGVTPIFVHILGAVARPGLYELHDGDRAVDAVAAAGGFTETADRRVLNLARFVSDGEQIRVPAIGEAVAAPGAPAAHGGAHGGADAGVAGGAGKVNLNTADAAALETLPRVGPAMAKRIIAWREEHGRFGRVDELLSVTGIGDKTFAELKDLVTV